MPKNTLKKSPQTFKPKASRPVMPKEYGIKGLRSGSGLVAWSKINKQLIKSHNYWIITARPNGHPHAMPVWGIWLGQILLFSTSRRSRKARNLEHNPNLVVHLESGDKAVILEGIAQEITQPKLLTQYVNAYRNKYKILLDLNDTKNVTYAVRPKKIFTWLERDFVGGATRFSL